MKYSQQTGVIVPFAQRFYKQLTLAVTGLFLVTSAVMTLGASAAPAPAIVSGCSFIQVGVNWKLVANCTSTAQINLPAGTRLDGNDKTIKAGFNFTDTSHNTVIGIIGADNVKIKDFTIDGNGKSGLYGINVYQSQNVDLDEVTIKNNQNYGLGVNGSEVTVKDFSTSNNFAAANVDQGVGVNLPSILTVKGRSHHTDMFMGQPAHIYVDNMNKAVQVNDVNNQYSFMHPNAFNVHPNDRLYTLKPVVNNHDNEENDD